VNVTPQDSDGEEAVRRSHGFSEWKAGGDPALNIHRILGGKIAQAETVVDMMGLMQQIGAIPARVENWAMTLEQAIECTLAGEDKASPNPTAQMLTVPEQRYDTTFR
jgi:hypothetical protein